MTSLMVVVATTFEVSQGWIIYVVACLRLSFYFSFHISQCLQIECWEFFFHDMYEILFLWWKCYGRFMTVAYNFTSMCVGILRSSFILNVELVIFMLDMKFYISKEFSSDFINFYCQRGAYMKFYKNKYSQKNCTPHKWDYLESS